MTRPVHPANPFYFTLPPTLPSINPPARNIEQNKLDPHKTKTKSIKFGDGRSVGLTTMGAMSVTVSLNTNGVGLDSTLSAVPVPGPTAANGSSPTTIGAVTSSPATVGAAPAVASAASITSAGVLTPRADL